MPGPPAIVDPLVTGPVVVTGSATAVGSLAAASAAAASAARSASLASLTLITDNRPIASAANSTMTIPRPVKKPICSTARVRVLPTGVPAVTLPPCQAGASTLPTANHAPPSTASQPPNSAAGR